MIGIVRRHRPWHSLTEVYWILLLLVSWLQVSRRPLDLWFCAALLSSFSNSHRDFNAGWISRSLRHPPPVMATTRPIGNTPNALSASSDASSSRTIVHLGVDLVDFLKDRLVNRCFCNE